MRTGMLWMAMGIAAVAWLPSLPSPTLFGLAIIVVALCTGCAYASRGNSTRRSAIRSICIAVAALMLGLIWGALYGYHIRSGLLPVELEQTSLLLQGRVDGLVEQREGFARFGKAPQRPTLRFQFAVDAKASIANNDDVRLPYLIQLNWYEAENAPQPGERWQLRVKLRRPRGFANPGGFDYATWLVANRIGATGYVERDSDNRQLTPASNWSIDALRGRAQNYLQQRLQSFAHKDLLLGLLIGDGGAIATTTWDTFRATGTVHLFVVSGLQIAFTGGLFLWGARLWWRSAWCTSRRINYLLGVLPAFFIALIYALLAGWGIPIQRALIMFAVLVWSLIARRQIQAATGWIAALWLVLLFDPLAVRDIGFWFSFIAVATILLIICGHRDDSTSKFIRNAWRWWHVQWALFATSIPLLLLLSGQLTLLALPANFIAIPLSTFISLPLAFLALIADFFAPRIGEILWRGADNSLDGLWRYLVWLQERGGALDHHNWAIWHPRGIDLMLCAFVAVAALLLLMPRGSPLKLFAAFLLVPLFAPPLVKIAQGNCMITVIDVGQGLSVLIETAQHRLLFDTGPQFGPERTVADLTVLPVLRQHGIAKLDAVIVSHNDSDHSGGWPALAREFDVDRLLVGETIADENIREEFCRAGMQWHWDAIDFDILYPTPAAIDTFTGNNRSCVLQISAGDVHILLTGDIERSAETLLLENPALQHATLLFAPHHGSRTSSTKAFIARVDPEYVVFSTGYLNRFKHPSNEVVERYRQQRAEAFDTAFTGALTFTITQGHVAQISKQRSQLRHYWD